MRLIRFLPLPCFAMFLAACSGEEATCVALDRDDIALPTHSNTLRIQQTSRVPIKYTYRGKCKVRRGGVLGTCLDGEAIGDKPSAEELQSVESALEGAKILGAKRDLRSTCATVEMSIQNG